MEDNGARKRVIMVMEQDPHTRNQVRSKIDNEGHLAFLMGDGTEAIELLESVLRVDIAVANIGFSGEPSGDDIIQTLREKYPSVRLIFMSTKAFREPYVMRRGEKLVPDSLRGNELLGAINEFLETIVD